MASYLKKEISEWNTNDLCNWLLANKFRGISELFQKYSLSGYDLFFIDDEILKNELNLKSFHERRVAMKLITKLTYEHLKLNVINSNGDNVILTLDNNPETKLGELSDYIGNMFNIDPKDILFKDSTKQEVLSPTLKIVQLLILYPKIYKTLNVSNIKDYRNAEEEELMESGSGEFPENNNMNMNSNTNMNNNNFKGKGSEIGIGAMSGMMSSGGEMDFQDMNNNNKFNNNFKMKNNKNYRGNYKNDNYNYNDNRKIKENENMKLKYNNNYMKMNNNKINNNQRQNENINDNYLLNSGSGDNIIPEQMNNNNNANMNGSSSNMEYNSNINYNRKRNYMAQNENIEEYQDNMGNNNERRNKNYQYNNEMMDNMMDYNEGNNFGISSVNDDEMKFKPSYQIKNNENNNYRE